MLDACSRSPTRRRLVAAAGAPDPAAAERIVRTAEGNPLFLEQLVAVGAGPGELPSTIHAVLAARLARLDPGERALLEHASVQGRTFHADAALVPEATAARLVALVQRQLIRPDRSALPGQDAFRFAPRADPRGGLPEPAAGAARASCTRRWRAGSTRSPARTTRPWATTWPRRTTRAPRSATPTPVWRARRRTGSRPRPRPRCCAAIPRRARA